MSFDYTADYGKIKIPTMITANEGDQFFAQQGAQGYNLLTNVPPDQKSLLQLTAAQGRSCTTSRTARRWRRSTSSTGWGRSWGLRADRLG